MRRRHRAKRAAQNDGHPQGWLRALRRDNFTCQLCGSHRNLEAHHLRRRSKGGSDSPPNLLTLCHGCHVLIHAGRIYLGVGGSGLFER